jgi:hypothetical protein
MLGPGLAPVAGVIGLLVIVPCGVMIGAAGQTYDVLEPFELEQRIMLRSNTTLPLLPEAVLGHCGASGLAPELEDGYYDLVSIFLIACVFSLLTIASKLITELNKEILGSCVQSDEAHPLPMILSALFMAFQTGNALWALFLYFGDWYHLRGLRTLPFYVCDLRCSFQACSTSFVEKCNGVGIMGVV